MRIGSRYRGSSGWWGMVTLIATEAFLFIYLLFTYAYFAIENGRAWLPAELPSFKLAGPNTLILLASSGVVWWAERQMRQDKRRRTLMALIAALILAGIFFTVQLMEWKSKPYQLASTSYASVYFTITGFHLAHVLLGFVILALLAVWTAKGLFDDVRMAPLSIGIAYWHFVDAVWLVVFFVVYITPRFG
ncbi:MAG: cytochrome c oxidase subunit 3 [Hyphomicrobium sp.]|nr:cytochrome c oxidase subunit 3 [Hyphomicrobium sp.]